MPDRAPNGSSASTGKWLSLEGAEPQRWRLPDDTNLDFIEAHIKMAMRRGEAFAFEVHDDTESIGRRVVLNGRALPFVVLYETRGA
jgi:hypothetical protein